MGLPVIDKNMSADDLDKMAANARHASSFLKAISHEGRLMILCHLASGEKSVTQLEALLSARQAAVSQQLSRLTADVSAIAVDSLRQLQSVRPMPTADDKADSRYSLET